MRALADSIPGPDPGPDPGPGLDTLADREATFDVLVVGGGPAGTTTALGLARLGLRVGLCEPAPPRRPKCCGQCLNPRVGAILERFGVLDAIGELAVGRTRRFEWRVEHHPDRREAHPRPREPGLDVGLDRSEPGWIVRREDLDERLWIAAVAAGAVPLRGVSAHVEQRCDEPAGDLRNGSSGGARAGIRAATHAATHAAIHAGTHAGTGEAPRVVRLDDALGGSRRIAARLVVGADGLGSGVARATGCAGRARVGRKFGFSGSIRAPEESLRRAVVAGCIHMRSIAGGYLGLVREDDGTVHVAGLVGPNAASRRPEAFVAEVLGLSEPPSLERPTACGPLPWRPRRITCPGVVLVGDASGYIEPFTGEGMAWAIEGAAALVDAVAEHGLGEAGRGAYVRRHRAAIARRQRTCRHLASILERPALVASAWRLADRVRLADRAFDGLGRRVAAGLVRA